MEPCEESDLPEDLIPNGQTAAPLPGHDIIRRRLSEMLPLPVAIIRRRDGVILYANELLEAMLARPASDLVGHGIQILCTHPANWETLLGTSGKEAAPGHCEVQAKKTDGIPFWVEASYRPLSFQEEDAVLIAFHDIAKWKLLEQELRLSKKMDVLGRLASGIAHDFNNLLTIIVGWSEIAMNKPGCDAPLKKHLEEIKEAGHRAASMTRQLLSFSSRHEERPQELDLNQIVAAMDTMLQRLIGEDIQLETVLDSQPSHVKANPSQVEQVIMNLIVNARDAMPHGGKISLRTAHVDINAPHLHGQIIHPGPYVRLTVTDAGQGMNQETQSRIFEPFFTTKEPGKGTGLGLSTVSEIVKQLGGLIVVQSEPERGSTFAIYLPKAEATPQPVDVVPAPSQLLCGTETILLVEDDPGVRKLIGQTLHRQGYTVIEARHGIEAWMIGNQYTDPIHLLLTDVVMPQMSGRAVADRLTPIHPEMKVLYISGHTDDAVFHHGIVDCGRDFLQKPFTPNRLVQKVRDLLDGPPRN